MHLRVEAMRYEADNVMSLELRDPSGAPLEPWSAGAHIDVVLNSGLVRQYSLCGPIDDPCAYRIAVRREEAGRGGSREVHDRVHVGGTIEVRGPRNHFELEPAASYVFIAGGIGITPILPMLAEARRRNIPYRLYYLGRSLRTMAFRRELESHGDAVHILPSDGAERLPLSAMIAGAGAADAIYCCGPARLIGGVEAACAERGLAERLFSERFASDQPQPGPDENRAFVAVIASTGAEIPVPPERTLLECLLDNGIDLLFSCEEGMCGSCEVRIKEGKPLHRDQVLNAAERERGDRMMACVSRAEGERLVLNL